MITTHEALFIVTLATIGGVLIGSGALVWLGFRKQELTTPNHARLLAKPGATLDLVSDDGVVQVKVILSHLTWTYNRGTSVEFEDYVTYMRERTYRGNF